MCKSLLLAAVLMLCLAPVVAVVAQDPFGADPFAADPFNADPFGTDPFGGGAAKSKQAAKPAAKKSVTVRPADAEARIRMALDKPTTASFVNLPLMDAVEQLGRQHDIPMVVDRRALEEMGIASDTPVSLSLRNVTLRSFLRLLLRELDLTYIIRQEVLQITTKEAAEANRVLQTYPFPQTLIEKSEQVIAALTATVTPNQWEARGGRSTVVAVENVLVVSGSDAVHEGVTDFLRKLDDAFRRHAATQKSELSSQP